MGDIKIGDFNTTRVGKVRQFFCHPPDYVNIKILGCLLGLERFALWPWTDFEICSLPVVSSSMSRDIVDLAPAESMMT